MRAPASARANDNLSYALHSVFFDSERGNVRLVDGCAMSLNSTVQKWSGICEEHMSSISRSAAVDWLVIVPDNLKCVPWSKCLCRGRLCGFQRDNSNGRNLQIWISLQKLLKPKKGDHYGACISYRYTCVNVIIRTSFFWRPRSAAEREEAARYLRKWLTIMHVHMLVITYVL